MRKFSFWPGSILCIFTLIVSIYFAFHIVDNANEYKLEKIKIAKVLDFNDRLLNISEAIPMYGDFLWNEKASVYEQSLENAHRYYQIAVNYGWLLSAFLLVSFLLFFLLYRKTNRWFGVSFGLLTLALVVLIVGLFAPMLELEAFKDNLSLRLEVSALDLIASAKQIEQNTIIQSIGLSDFVTEGIETLKKWLPSELINFKKTYPDRMYFFYQNKGVFDLIKVLWFSSSIPMAIIIGLFSVLLPIVKMTASFVVLFGKYRSTSRFRKFINSITKFSMLDVFVAASFVTFFSFSQINTGISTESRVLIGLYFFTAYVLLSILAGISLNKFTASQKTINS